ncbi:unnamed protein product [Pleuronectes platessa]|uniref:Uncharacterized protein n=1 Tax=Pleuronectes platessa TaxID=8262 RepID=A0A9N7TPD0_PLEPL|nr:unnamed protein product [Pleuronectes platessa]
MGKTGIGRPTFWLEDNRSTPQPQPLCNHVLNIPLVLTGLPLLTSDCVHLPNTGLGLITSPPSARAVSVKKHTGRALILRLRMEFAVWAEGDEYNGEKIEEKREGEWG